MSFVPICVTLQLNKQCIVAFLDLSFSQAYFAILVRLIYLVPLGVREGLLLLHQFFRSIFLNRSIFGAHLSITMGLLCLVKKAREVENCTLTSKTNMALELVYQMALDVLINFV